MAEVKYTRKTFEHSLWQFVRAEISIGETLLQVAQTAADRRQFERAEKVLQKARTAQRSAVEQLRRNIRFTAPPPPEIWTDLDELAQALSVLEESVSHSTRTGYSTR